MRILFCYAVPALMIGLGLWHVFFPHAAWKLARLDAQTKGHATSDAPEDSALAALRIKGFVIAGVGIVFGVFSHMFFSEWEEPTKPDPSFFERPGK